LSLATAWSGKKRAKRGWVDAGVVATVAPAVITTATLGTGEHMSGSRDESVEDEDEAFDEDESLGEGQTAFDDRLDEAVAFSESVIRGIEVVAAYVLVGLFAIGVFDLGLQIAEQALSGRIFQPEVVVGFIDTALLLFIIVEVYQTVVAYTRVDDTRRIVRLVIYTGIIAIVRKVIIFRTELFDEKAQALLTAGSYTIILLALAGLLLVERRYVAE
jgi:uncharacterized membrane protein (DUF373 family)